MDSKYGTSTSAAAPTTTPVASATPAKPIAVATPEPVVKRFLHPNFSAKVPADVKAWPESTNVYCFHDRHPFQGAPFAELVHNDAEKNVMTFQNVYCSLSCGLAHVTESLVFNTAQRTSTMHLGCARFFEFYNIITDPSRLIGIAALPWTMLKEYGGTLEIDEFRKLNLSKLC